MTDRFQRGLENLRKIDGEVGQKVIDGLRDISPDLARYTIEYPFADIYARPGLDLYDREIATIAALTAMETAHPQLKVHIQAGLNVGLTQDENEEIIIQMSVYAGFPPSIERDATSQGRVLEHRIGRPPACLEKRCKVSANVRYWARKQKVRLAPLLAKTRQAGTGP